MPSSNFQRDVQADATVYFKPKPCVSVTASDAKQQSIMLLHRCCADVARTCCTDSDPPAPAEAALEVHSETNIRAAIACESLGCQVACSHKHTAANKHKIGKNLRIKLQVYAVGNLTMDKSTNLEDHLAL